MSKGICKGRAGPGDSIPSAFLLLSKQIAVLEEGVPGTNELSREGEAGRGPGSARGPVCGLPLGVLLLT